MNSPDLKKLVAGFLALSAVASTITLVSLKFIGTGTSEQQSLDVEGSNPLATVSKDATVEKLNWDGKLADKTDGSAVNDFDPSNMTKNFAKIFAGEMMAKNPNGPQADQDGNPTLLNMPGADNTADMIKQALLKTSFDFNEKVTVPNRKFTDNFDRADVIKYLNITSGIINDFSSGIRNLNNADSNSIQGNVESARLLVEAAFEKINSIGSVPSSLADVHRAVLKFLANQKNIFDSFSNYESDPVKAIVALQEEDNIVSRDTGLIKSELNKSMKDLSYEINLPKQNFISKIFGIQKIYAQAEVQDVATEINTYQVAANTYVISGTAVAAQTKSISDWLYTTAVRIAVNIVINELQNEIVNWVAGNGKPKFITNWRDFIKNIENKAAGEIIYSLAPALCTGLGPLVKLMLLPVPIADTSVRCTLNQVVSNIQRFRDSFSNGGWIALGYSMQVPNNLFGALIQVNDYGLIKSNEAQTAAQNEGLSGQGYLSVTKCVHYTENPYTNEQICDDYQSVTPGTAISGAINQTLGWKVNQVVSAQRLDELAYAVVNAAVNRMVLQGLAALTESTNPDIAGGTSGDLQVIRDQVNSLLNSVNQSGVFQQVQAVIDNDSQWLNYKDSTISALNQFSTDCSTSTTTNISQMITNVNILASSTRAEITVASVNTYGSIQNEIYNATTTADLANIANRLQNMNIKKVTDGANAARGRLTELQNIVDTINYAYLNSLSQSICYTAVPTLDIKKDLTSIANSLLDFLNMTGVFGNIQTIMDTDKQWLSTKDDVITALNQYPSTCQPTNILQTRNEIASLTLDVQSELGTASSSQKLAIQNSLTNASSTDALIGVSNQIQGIDVAYFADTASAAKDRLTGLQNLLVFINESNSYGVCDDLPSATSTTPIHPNPPAVSSPTY